LIRKEVNEMINKLKKKERFSIPKGVTISFKSKLIV